MTYLAALTKLKKRNRLNSSTNKRKKVKPSSSEEEEASIEWRKYFNHRLRTRQQVELENILEHFANCLEKFKTLKNKSDSHLKQLLTPLELYGKSSSLFVNTDEENNPSIVSCAFGPTDSSYKYEPFIHELNSKLNPRTVLVLSEAHGTGKSYLAYHLVKEPNNRIVLPVTLSITSLLQSKLQKLAKRKEMDELAGRFFANLMAFGCFLYDYSKEHNFSHPGISIIRFLLNEGATLIGKCETFLQDLQPKQHEGKSVCFLMDEVQHFNTQDISSKTSPQKEEGNAITLYSSSIRKMAPLIMTTTLFESIRSELENLESNPEVKNSVVYSFDFPRPLPVLNSIDVVPFLQQFISIENKFSNVWNIVSYFIQGPIKRCEHFLQCMITNLESNSAMKLSYQNLIYLTIENVLSAYRDEEINVQTTNDLLALAFFQLAVFGEVIVNNDLPFSTYLLTNSISYYFKAHEKLFQVFSPIDQRMLFNTVKQLAQQSNTDWLTYTYQKLNWKARGISEKFIKLLLTYYLLNHFTDIAQEFSGSYLSDYSLKASYYVNDIRIDLKNSVTSLMLKTLDQTSSMNDSNMTDSFCVHSLSEMIIMPDIETYLLGILVRDGAIIEKESYIPLICATSDYLDGYYMYKYTDIRNRFDQMQNYQPSNSYKMLRILFNPKSEETTSLKERISAYSFGSDECVMEYSNNAIMTDKGHLVYEINASNAKWKEFTKQMGWLEHCNKI